MDDSERKVSLHLGDCLVVMAGMEPNSVDAIVTDPPYGLGFMGKDWDHGVPGVHFWEEALRVAKPGAHLLAFGGTRTFHRLACAIEDAGWEIRDTIMWVYGSGFPKSHDVSKAIDKAAGAERMVVGVRHVGGTPGGGRMRECNLVDRGDGKTPDGRDYANARAYKDARQHADIPETAPATPDAATWAGWGTALKPAWEPIIVARKPLDGTVAANVLAWGTGAINVDGCRVGTETIKITGHAPLSGFNGSAPPDATGSHKWNGNPDHEQLGRWPANLIHDGSDEVMALFPVTTSGKPNGSTRHIAGYATAHEHETKLTGFGDTGSAARFFYCAKTSRDDRDEGTEGLNAKHAGHHAQDAWSRENMGNTPDAKRQPIRNHHPTVKPTSLMRYLCRLVTPPGGVVLDPFMGSGSTGKAAMLEGFGFIGIEVNAEYLAIAEVRIQAARGRVVQLAMA